MEIQATSSQKSRDPRHDRTVGNSAFLQASASAWNTRDFLRFMPVKNNNNNNNNDNNNNNNTTNKNSNNYNNNDNNNNNNNSGFTWCTYPPIKMLKVLVLIITLALAPAT